MKSSPLRSRSYLGQTEHREAQHCVGSEEVPGLGEAPRLGQGKRVQGLQHPELTYEDAKRPRHIWYLRFGLV